MKIYFCACGENLHFLLRSFACFSTGSSEPWYWPLISLPSLFSSSGRNVGIPEQLDAGVDGSGWGRGLSHTTPEAQKSWALSILESLRGLLSCHRS